MGFRQPPFFHFLLLGLSGMLAGLVRGDVLVFPDGERIAGSFIRREKGQIVFQSKNLGPLTVPEKGVKLELEEVAPPPTQDMEADSRGETQEARGFSRIRPLQRMGTRVFSWWEPWQGRVSVSLDLLNDSNERRIMLGEFRARREWTRDSVQGEVRYENRKENGVETVNQTRALGTWRRDLTNWYFTSYRPELIRDTRNSSGLQSFPYVMLRQQVGLGYHLAKKENRKLRIGVAENFYNVWPIADGEATAERTESIFFEAELKLPWRITATERFTFHYSFAESDPGIENEFEFTKRFSDSISIGIRQEFRENNPDSRVKDNERLRLLLGYDF